MYRQKHRHLLTRSDCLRLATTSLIHIETKFLGSDNPLLGLIILSVKTLIQSLGGATEYPIPSGCQVVPLPAKALHKIMLSNGWCIHQCDRVCRSHNVDTVYYLSMLPRQAAPGITHVSCTEAVCSAWSMTTNGLLKHIEPGCRCPMITISSEDVGSIIKNGDIPLVSIHIDTENCVHLKLQ